MNWRATDLIVGVAVLAIATALGAGKPRRRRRLCPRLWCLGHLVAVDGTIRCTRCTYTRPELPIDQARPPIQR